MLTRKINNEIRAAQVMVIDEEGNKLGVLALNTAKELSDEKGLDLVQVTDDEIPVCRLQNFSKLEYERKKKEKKGHKVQKTKEVHFAPFISEHDLKIKVRHLSEFLAAGCKVKVAVKYGNRRLAHDERMNVVENIINTIKKNISVPYKVDGNPNIGVNEYSIILTS